MGDYAEDYRIAATFGVHQAEDLPSRISCGRSLPSGERQIGVTGAR